MAVDTFPLFCVAHGLPKPECEVVFAPPRKFRADYCWPAPYKVIVEREGGLWSKVERARRAHAMPLKILRDMEKSNVAQVLGYRYFRFTPDQLCSQAAMDMLKQVLC